MDPSPSMDTLPIEIITHIMQYLRHKDKQRASLVCKKWFKASIDPSINSKVFFKLGWFDDGRVKPPTNDALEGIGRRNISNLRLYDISHKFYDVVRNWSGYKSITRNITAIEITEFTETNAVVILDIIDHCSNIQTVDMYVNTLFKVLLQDDFIRDEMLGVLADLPRLILNVESSSVRSKAKEIEHLMILPKVEQLKISGADLSENSSPEGLTVSLYGFLFSKIPISTLRTFCEKHGCLLSIGLLNCSRNKIRLAIFLGLLGGFPKFKVGHLNVTLFSVSELNDVNQISDINVNSLDLRLDFNTNEWFTRNSLSSLVSASPSLSCLSFPLSVQQDTLDCILGGLPNVELVEVGQCPFVEYMDEPNPIPEDKRCRYVKVLFRTAKDGKPKWLEIMDTNIEKVLITRTSLMFCDVHPNLQTFVFTGIFTFQDSDFVLKLITCFPGLTAVCLSFEKTDAEYVTERDMANQVDLSLFSRLKELQTLQLTVNSYLAKIKMNGLKFPKLKELDLSGCVNLTNECLQEIGKSMQNLESLDISHCSRVGDVALQSVLTSLTHLRELIVIGCEQVNSTTLKMISSCSSSLEILWVSKGNDEFTAAIEEIRESRSNLKIKEYEETRERKRWYEKTSLSHSLFPGTLFGRSTWPVHFSVSTTDPSRVNTVLL